MKKTANFLLAVFVAVILSGACGGNGGVKVLAAASDVTAESGTARIAFSMRSVPSKGATAEGAVPPFELEGDGLVDFSQGNTLMTLDLAGLGIPGMGDTTTEFRTIGGVIYSRVPGASLGGRPWVKFDIDALKEADSSALAGLDPSGSDPSRLLDALRGVAGEVEEVGEESVRGVSTRHYKASISVADALDKIPEQRREAFSTFADRLEISQLPVDVWVDDEGRTRRISYRIDAPAGGPLTGSFELSTELYDFGTDVQIVAPPDAEVTDFGELEQGE